MGLARLILRNIAVVLLLSLVSPLSIAEQIYVLIKTDRGNITLELLPEEAPATVANFLSYVNRYYYDGLIFHRVVKGFVIQSGGYTFDLFQKETSEPVINESGNGLKNLRGTVAMARYSDPDSATSQFYINLSNNTNLDPANGKPGYTVFGRVIDGMEVVDEIGATPVTKRDKFSHVPQEAVQILSIRKLNHP